MTFRPKHLPFEEALRVVHDRLNLANGQRNPLFFALSECAILPEIRENEKWRLAKNGEWEKLSVWFPSPYMGGPQSPEVGEIAHTNIRLASADIDRLWPLIETNEKKQRGGRPPLDWESFLIEIVRLANLPDGLPSKQSDLEQTMLQWCAKTWGKEPGESTVRQKVSAVYAAIRKGQKVAS